MERVKHGNFRRVPTAAPGLRDWIALPGVSLLLIAVFLIPLRGSPAAIIGPEPLRIPVVVDVPERGLVSLALYDTDGVLTRSLLAAEPVEKGAHTVPWDGTTDLGVPAKAGAYTARGIFFPNPPSLRYVMTVGKSGNPPYRTPDGKGDWGANLGHGTSITANSRSLIMGWACVEDNQITGIQQTDADGNIENRYFSFYPWDGRLAATMDETHYFLGIYNYQKHTTEIAQYTIGEPRGKILTALPVKAIPQKSGRWKDRPTSHLDGIAVTADTLFASVAHEDALFVIDRATGKIRRRVEIPSPRGLAVSGDRLMAVSGNTVVALGLDGTLQTTLVADGAMQAPNALTTDKAGNMYVGDSGATFALDPESEAGTRQVWVFSPHGKLLRKLGKPGGTPREGRFDPDGFGIITALCIGPDDKLWAQDVATGFKRTSRWSLDGKLEAEWFTRKIQHVADMINPARPHELLSARDAADDSPPGLYAYEINLEAKTWKPSWFYELTVDEVHRPADGVFIPHDHSGREGIRSPAFDFSEPSFVTFQGRNYVLSGGGNGEGAIHIYGPDQPPQPVALVSYHRAEKRDGVIHGFYDQGPNNWFSWVDRDANGRMRMDEVTFTENPANLAGVRRVFQARLTEGLVIRLKLLIEVNREGRQIDALLPPKEILANGAPVYDWSLLRETVQLQPPDFQGGDGIKKIGELFMAVPVETTDAFYSIVVPGSAQPLRLPGIDGDGWWASRNWRKKLVRFDKETGKPVWAVGRRAPGRAGRGQMYNPIMLAGAAGDALLVADGLAVVWVWHKDGLYLGRLYNDFGTGVQDANSLYVELQGTEVYTDKRSGNIYSIANDTSASIHEVMLPATRPLKGSTVKLSAEQIDRVQPWDPDGPAPTEKPTYTVHRVTGSAGWPLKIDGDFDGREGWDNAGGGKGDSEILVLLDGQRVASVRAMYDAEYLYLAYNVQAPHGPINSGSELPLGPFVSGAYVDFCVGPNWNGPRDEVRAGDVRVILARIKEGAGFQDFQQGFWPKKPGGTNPQTIVSPAARETFDDVSPLPGLRMAYRVGEKDNQTGLVSYQVEVAVPLSALGLIEPAGQTVGFDASVAVANAPGDRRERAAHWAGLSEAVVVDRPGSARLIPATWGTLRFVR